MGLEIDRLITKEYLIIFTELKSSGLNELHPRVLKEMAKELPTLIIF